MNLILNISDIYEILIRNSLEIPIAYHANVIAKYINIYKRYDSARILDARVSIHA